MNDIARLAPSAPWRWMRAGWDDFCASWRASLSYGFVFAGMGKALPRVFESAYE